MTVNYSENSCINLVALSTSSRTCPSYQAKATIFQKVFSLKKCTIYYLQSSKVSNSFKSTQSHLSYIHVSRLAKRYFNPSLPLLNYDCKLFGKLLHKLSDNKDCAHLGLSAYEYNKIGYKGSVSLWYSEWHAKHPFAGQNTKQQ